MAGVSAARMTEYPRITYAIAVKLAMYIHLTLGDNDANAILPACLDRDLADSQEVGEFWRRRGVQGMLYPSAVPELTGTNVIVFRDVAPEPEIVLVNRGRIIEEFRRLSRRSPN